MSEDPIGRAFGSFFLIIAISLLVGFALTYAADEQAQSISAEALADFTDNVRSTGYIDATELSLLRNRLSKTGYGFTIEMLHRSKVAMPTSGGLRGESPIAGNYTVAYHNYNYDDILAALNDSDYYEMKNGDLFQVHIRSIKETNTSIFTSIFRGGVHTHIDLSSGGYVGNTK